MWDEALKSYRYSIKLNPNIAESYLNLGIALQEKRDLNNALISYEKSLLICGDNIASLINCGNVLRELGQFEKAIYSFNKALNISKKEVEAYIGLGNVYQEMKKYKLSIQNYENAFFYDKDFDYLIGEIMYMKMCICDWSNFELSKELIIEKVKSNKKVIQPFPLLLIEDSSSTLKQAAKIWVQDKFVEDNSFGSITKVRNQKIRIGYFSADFYDHATSHLIAEFLELHDKNQFEIFGFYFGPKIIDSTYTRIQKTFNQFIDIGPISDLNAAKLARNLKLDIAVDLKGFTKMSRFKIFAYRVAPIQISYLGYPGTTSANYIDYLLADRIVIPIDNEHNFSEKVIPLPGSYQINDRKKLVSKKVFLRSDFYLPEKGFIFCCFNNNFKITPSCFNSWMNILKAVSGSVLWLLEDNESASNNIKQEAQKRGVDPTRIIFAKRIEMSDHLARHQLANLFIDTFPYNAHTTASDSLWSDLPLMTLAGESFQSRVAASLLNSIGLPELVTDSIEEYEKLAIELATNNNKLNAIKLKLQKNKLEASLFCTEKETQNIEKVYKTIYEEYQLEGSL